MQREKIKNVIALECARATGWAELPNRDAIERAIERGCFNVAITDCVKAGVVRSFDNVAFVNRYSTVCYRVINNIANAPDVVLGPIMTEPKLALKLGTMTSVELNPGPSANIRADITTRQAMPDDDRFVKSAKCKYCASTRITKRSFQTRGSDEANTETHECKDCSSSWRI